MDIEIKNSGIWIIIFILFWIGIELADIASILKEICDKLK
jgi:hypothetical protein